jgi:AraC-like DNA-binding protein
MISGETTGLRCRRGGRLLADGDDNLVFHTNRSGFSVVSQAGRECRVDGGAAVLMTAGEPGAHDFPKGSGQWLTLCIPRKRLPGLDRMPEDAVARPIRSRAEPLRLLVDYIDLGFRQDQLASPQLRQVFATHVYDLVALAIGAARDDAEVARGRGLRAARLNAAKGEIARRLEEGLAVTDVAGRLGVTPRYIQRLFESEGTTFTEYVTGQRLARAHRILSDSRFLDRSIITIAFDVGFANLSHFNRLFRRHYGATPSDVREAARHEAQ